MSTVTPPTWFSADELAGSADRHGRRAGAAAARELGDVLVPLLFVATGVGRRLAGRFDGRSWVVAALVIVALLEVAGLPHRALCDGAVEVPWRRRHGERGPLGGFLAAFAGLAVGRLVAAAGLAVGGLAVVRATPWWPLVVWGLVVGTGLVWAWAHPVLVAPLVERTVPLERLEVAARLAQLADRAGLGPVPVDVGCGVSRGEGAHVAGIGRTRRLVVDAALLEGSARDVEVVVAHELGHWRLGHPRAALVEGAALAGAALALSWLVGHLSGTDLGSPAALPLWLLCLALLGGAGALVEAASSRRQELEADRFAARLVGGPVALDQLRRHYLATGADLRPGRWSRLRSCHPAPERRLTALASLAATAEPGGGARSGSEGSPTAAIDPLGSAPDDAGPVVFTSRSPPARPGVTSPPYAGEAGPAPGVRRRGAC